MFRVFLFLLFILQPFFASDLSPFGPCIERNQLSLYHSGSHTLIALSTTELLSVDVLEKDAGIHVDGVMYPVALSLYDPYLGIWIYRISRPLLTPVVFRDTRRLVKGEALAAVRPGNAVIGRLLEKQQGLSGFARFEGEIRPGDLVGARCYAFVGVGIAPGRFLEANYIRHLLTTGKPRYGDIGVWLKEVGGTLEVVATDPFMPGNPFQIGDRLVAIGGEDAPSAMFEQLFFATPGGTLEVSYQREGKRHTVVVPVEEHYGGGKLPETFLERFGLRFTEHFRVSKVEGGSLAQKQGIEAGDRLLEVDRQRFSSFERLRHYLSLKQEMRTTLLFERNDFQFFFVVP